MDQNEEMQIFKLISSSGAAKSAYMEAIKNAKQGNVEKSRELFTEGDEEFIAAHDIHLAMISAASQGVSSPATLIHVHAEDQLMATEITKTLAREIAELYRTTIELRQEVAELRAKLTS